MVQFHLGILKQHGQREGHESYHLEKRETWTPIVTPTSLVSIWLLLFFFFFTCTIGGFLAMRKYFRVFDFSMPKFLIKFVLKRLASDWFYIFLYFYLIVFLIM